MSFMVPMFFEEADFLPFRQHHHHKAPRMTSRHCRRHPMAHRSALFPTMALPTLSMEWEPRRKRPEGPALREIVNVKGFKPDDLKIEVSEDKKKLNVTAKREEEEDGMTITRHLNKSFDIPENCDIEKLNKIFASNGKLVLVAPKVKEAEPESEEERNEDSEMDDCSVIAPFQTIFGSAGKDKVEDTEDNFKVSLNTEGFKPEDLQVELSPDGKTLTVKGKHEEKTEDSHVSRQIHRTFTLPHNVKSDEIQSTFTKDGVLSISAPKDPALKEIAQEAKKLPITAEN